MQNVQCWGLKELGWEHCFRTHIFKCKYIHAYIKSLPMGFLFCQSVGIWDL